MTDLVPIPVFNQSGGCVVNDSPMGLSLEAKSRECLSNCGEILRSCNAVGVWIQHLSEISASTFTWYTRLTETQLGGRCSIFTLK